MEQANIWIEKLELLRHPEGGYFRETYRSEEVLAAAHLPKRFTGPRSFSTAIYFLLEGKDFSAFHRIKQDEIWHFYAGTPLILHTIEQNGRYYTIRLGQNIGQGEKLQAVIKAGDYFGAEVADLAVPTDLTVHTDLTITIEPNPSFSLVGCTVAPGFDFADFELPKREALLALYPQHEVIITRLTRD